MRIVTLDRAGSTNDEVMARAEAGEALPFAVQALEQDAGRGRLGRGWASPRGGVWLSAGERWEGVVPGSVALRAAVAVLDAVAPELPAGEGARLTIKWPNDLLLDGEKIAGVLCERRALADGAACLVIGVGINADFDAASLPSNVRTPATTLRTALGRPIDAEALAARLALSLSAVIRRAAEPLEPDEVRAVVDRLAYLEEPVRFSRLDGAAVEGTLAGLAPDGRAGVRVAERIEWVSAGDVDRAAPAGG
jgi:BirA family biotin operon repressor/biotin-[acetyl-CoA-carboxylase] ligase